MRRLFRPILLILMAGLLLAGPAIAVVLEPGQDSDRPDQGMVMLWRVRSGTATAYILGSVHIAHEDAYPLPEVMEQAFQASDVLAVEVDITTRDSQAREQLRKKLMEYPDGGLLADSLSPMALRVLERQGLDAAAYNSTRPFGLAMLLQQQAYEELGFTAELGIDYHFLKQAKERTMPVKELEGTEEQLDVIRALSPEVEEMFLLATVMSLETMGQQMETLFTRWESGDVKGMSAYLPESSALTRALVRMIGADTFYEALIGSRNDRMTDRLEEYLADGRTHFVVMGCLHVIGERGVAGQLKQRGYEVEQLSRFSEL